jgi:hypothetical protein
MQILTRKRKGGKKAPLSEGEWVCGEISFVLRPKKKSYKVSKDMDAYIHLTKKSFHIY